MKTPNTVLVLAYDGIQPDETIVTTIAEFLSNVGLCNMSDLTIQTYTNSDAERAIKALKRENTPQLKAVTNALTYICGKLPFTCQLVRHSRQSERIITAVLDTILLEKDERMKTAVGILAKASDYDVNAALIKGKFPISMKAIETICSCYKYVSR